MAIFSAYRAVLKEKIAPQEWPEPAWRDNVVAFGHLTVSQVLAKGTSTTATQILARTRNAARRMTSQPARRLGEAVDRTVHTESTKGGASSKVDKDGV